MIGTYGSQVRISLGGRFFPQNWTPFLRQGPWKHSNSTECLGWKAYIGTCHEKVSLNCCGPQRPVHTKSIRVILLSQDGNCKCTIVAERPGLPDGICIIFVPKFPVWVYFRGPWNEECWYVWCPFGIFYIHLKHLRPFGIFSPVLVYCSNKSLVTLYTTANNFCCILYMQYKDFFSIFATFESWRGLVSLIR
jgi:hypothetical protein